jgi:VWFA-related protein
VEGKVKLDVAVFDSGGKPAGGLDREDFTLLDDNRPQEIVSFQAQEVPAEVILLIDTVNTPFERVAYIRQEVEKFLRRNDGHLSHPTSIAIFSDAGLRLQLRPSTDGKVLLATLAQSRTALRTLGPSSGPDGELRRFQLSMLAVSTLISKEGNKPGRKLVVWLGTGWPLLTGWNVAFSAHDQQRFFNSIVELSTGLRDARVTLYSIDPPDLSRDIGSSRYIYQKFLAGVKTAKQADAGNLALPVLAVQSGGLAMSFSDSVADQIKTCLADAYALYSISFDPSNSGRDDEYHSLEVKVGKAGLTARTNTGYYSHP